MNLKLLILFLVYYFVLELTFIWGYVTEIGYTTFWHIFKHTMLFIFFGYLGLFEDVPSWFAIFYMCWVILTNLFFVGFVLAEGLFMIWCMITGGDC